ncbi:MAG: hypothetical protein QXK96_01860 [Candidatus Bathyarchaeia archaeon]
MASPTDAEMPACIRIKGADDVLTLTNEQSPTRERLSKVFRTCSLDAHAKWSC